LTLKLNQLIYLLNHRVNFSILILVLTIISGPDIFLKIGKACAKSETKRELGLMCLEDYIHLLKFSHNYKLNDKKETKKQKAYFWMCILNIQLRQYK